jgi:hypothetical protein
VRIGREQVSDYSMCMSHNWRGGGTALCAIEGWVGGCCGGVANIFLLAWWNGCVVCVGRLYWTSVDRIKLV